MLQGLEGEQVVAVNEEVVEAVGGAAAGGGAVRLLGVFEEDAGFEPGALVFANPGEFEAGGREDMAGDSCGGSVSGVLRRVTGLWPPPLTPPPRERGRGKTGISRGF